MNDLFIEHLNGREPMKGEPMNGAAGPRLLVDCLRTSISIAGTYDGDRWRGLDNIVGERTLVTPVALPELVALERGCETCLEAHHVQLVGVFLSLDGRRTAALFRAPDAESVRLAYRHAKAPFDRVWPYRG